MRASNNLPHDHHYVPQFYMRQFAMAEDKNKIAALWKAPGAVLAGARSIVGIGHEPHLHTVQTPEGALNLDPAINKTIESPLTASPTWRKIVAEDAASLNEGEDRTVLYGLIKHLEGRNLEGLRFLEEEMARIEQHGFPADYGEDERAMHLAIRASPGGAKAYFQMMASSLPPTPDEAETDFGLMVYQSKTKLRTSTQPVMPVGEPNGPGPKMHWLPLSPHFGVMLAEAPGGAFFRHGLMPQAFARHLNRLRVVQLLKGISVRYCFADDAEIDDDLAWAGFQRDEESGKTRRYRRQSGAPDSNWLDDVWRK